MRHIVIQDDTQISALLPQPYEVDEAGLAAAQPIEPAQFNGYTITFDGSCEPNPGQMSYGVCVLDPQGKCVYAERGEPKVPGTNNRAELLGLIRALQVAAAMQRSERYQKRRLRILGDSKYAIAAINDQQDINKGEVNRRLFARAQDARRALEPDYEQKLKDKQPLLVPVEWIPDEENGRAHDAAKR